MKKEPRKVTCLVGRNNTPVESTGGRIGGLHVSLPLPGFIP